MTKLIIPAIFIGTLVGCTNPVKHSGAPMRKYDQHTLYSIEENPNGFTISIDYSRYQFIPESAANEAACRSALTSTAWDIAEEKGKKIEPINEQRIKISMGRNGLTGITKCSASAPVEWKDKSL